MHFSVETFMKIKLNIPVNSSTVTVENISMGGIQAGRIKLTGYIQTNVQKGTGSRGYGQKFPYCIKGYGTRLGIRHNHTF